MADLYGRAAAFKQPGSGRTPDLLRELQAGGMMPADMHLARFMTMPSPDYLGTLNENNTPSTGTPAMAKNRLPIASLQQPPLPEPRFEPGPYADMTPVPGYSEVPGFTPDRTAAIGQVVNPEPQPLDVGDVIAQMNASPAPVFDGNTARTAQLDAEFKDIRRRGMQAADVEAAQKRAELENWMNKGGLSSSGVYSSPKPGAWTADAQAGVDSFVANNPRPSPTTLNRLPGEVPPSMRPSPVAQATGAYVPGGNESFGAIPAVRTGDPFMDDTTNWAQLSKDREIKNKNDAHFTAMNDARLGGIASDRQAADAKRAANLAAQGMTQKQIDMRMHPERFAAPKDPGIAQAQAVDAAERQGRSNLHAIAQKFMRNGLSPAAAYSAAMNVTPTTNPGNMGAVPSLPGLDPMRVIQTSSPGTGMAAAQQSVGTTQSENQLLTGNQRNDTERYGIDSRERVGMAQAANGGNLGLMEMLLKLQQQQMNQGVVNSEQTNQARDAALAFIQSPQGQQMQYGTPQEQAIYRQRMQEAQGGGQQSQPGPLSGAMGIPQQGTSPTDNPIAMQQILGRIADPAERQRQEAMMYAQSGKPHPSVDAYLAKFRDAALMNPTYAAEMAAAEGFPRDVALNSFIRLYGQGQ